VAQDPSVYNKRVVFRVAFSAIEGLIFMLKTQLLDGLPIEEGTYSLAEIALLREEGYQLDNRGNTVVRTQFLRAADNLLFTWKMYFRGILPEFAVDLSGSGWNSFMLSALSANRITHPRSSSDLELTDDDVKGSTCCVQLGHSDNMGKCGGQRY